jgi:hypothetical protein
MIIIKGDGSLTTGDKGNKCQLATCFTPAEGPMSYYYSCRNCQAQAAIISVID